MSGRYAKGARYERRARTELETAGWAVMRAAGSKGPADLVAVKVRYIQVKAVSEPRGWAGELEELKENLPNGPGISKELWVWNKGCGWEKHEVSDENRISGD